MNYSLLCPVGELNALSLFYYTQTSSSLQSLVGSHRFQTLHEGQFLNTYLFSCPIEPITFSSVQCADCCVRVWQVSSSPYTQVRSLRKKITPQPIIILCGIALGLVWILDFYFLRGETSPAIPETSAFKDCYSHSQELTLWCNRESKSSTKLCSAL